MAVRTAASDPKRTVDRIGLEQATAALLRVAMKITGEMLMSLITYWMYTRQAVESRYRSIDGVINGDDVCCCRGP
jgi:hypothetical protein